MIGEVTYFSPLCSNCERDMGGRYATREEALAAMWPGELCFTCYCMKTAPENWIEAYRHRSLPAGNDVLPETAPQKRPPVGSETGYFAPDIEADFHRGYDGSPYIVISSPPERRGRIARVFGTRRKSRR